jgi:hypothetical protein
MYRWTDGLTDGLTDELIWVVLGKGGLVPLQTESSPFCKMKYLLEKKYSNKNEENHLNDLKEIFLMIYGLPE